MNSPHSGGLRVQMPKAKPQDVAGLPIVRDPQEGEQLEVDAARRQVRLSRQSAYSTDVIRTVDPAGAKNLGTPARRETEGVRQPVER